MPPTRAEISRELGFKSPNAAEEHLKALARKGAIEIVAGALAVFALLMTVQMMRKKKACRITRLKSSLKRTVRERVETVELIFQKEYNKFSSISKRVEE